MAWLDPKDIREKFSIAANRFETQLQAAIESAALIIQRGVEADIYTEAIDDTPPVDATELVRYKSVIEAHSFLTMWFLVGNVGNRLGEAGFVKQAQDAGSPATTQTITNQYLTPTELAAIRQQFFDNAKLWISPYGSIDVTVDIAGAETSISFASLQWF